MAKWWYGGLLLSVEYDNFPEDWDLCCFINSFSNTHIQGLPFKSIKYYDFHKKVFSDL
jgi:hypothetical protein